MKHTPKRSKKKYRSNVILAPPATKRWCMQCERMRTFDYNKTIGHSACSQCGWRKIH